MNKEEIRIKCLELAVDHINHLKHWQENYRSSEDDLIRIAEKFESYITKEEKED